MKKSLLISSFLFLFSIILNGQEIPIPPNYTLLASEQGDLDKDGIGELVVAYNTQTQEGEESVPRELIIYKWEKETWVEWKKSRQALYGSRDGGMMGDPFEEIAIKKGILWISHYGGSSWKWGFTDKYRYQAGEMFLIGYTSKWGKHCEDWEHVDFNLSTGKMIVKKEYEDCNTEEIEVYKRENETLYKKGFKITLQKRNEQEIKIVTPKYGHEIYLATEM